MCYKIIDTKISSNSRICYSIFKRAASVDTLTAYTYGIVAADFEGSYSIDDILTDENEIRLMVANLCSRSVQPVDLLNYVICYLDNM